MTRILVLTNFYPPHSHGGYELSCADVMTRLAGRGHAVEVLTSRYRRPGAGGQPGPARGLPAGSGVEPAGAGVEVHRSLDIYWEDHVLTSPPPLACAAVEWRNQRTLRKALDRFRPQVVSAWNMAAMSLGLLDTVHRRGVPTVHAVCNDWLVWGPGMDGWQEGWSHRPAWQRRLGRVTGLPTELADLGGTGTFLFVSEWTRRWAEEHSRWTYPDSAVVYSGIDPEDFPVVPEAENSRPPWRWRLLFVGRLEPDKGVDTAVRALAHLPAEAVLDVVGPGSDAERRRVETAAEEAGVTGRVRFSEAPRSELAARYRQVDAVVFPSRWEEPFGLVPLEAMACGTPVVATRTGGSAEFLVEGANCLAFPREDPAALAGALRRLAGDAGLRRHLRAGGRVTAAELTVDRLADCFEAWLTAAAEGFPHGRPPGRTLPPLPG